MRGSPPPEPVPVSVLTGFLGAGKTTLLNRLLADPAARDWAVIVNEFGEIGIDHLLVEQASEGIVALSGGCLCCTVRGDLVDTLADLLERLGDGRIARLSRIVVETTGLADPVPVLQSVMGHPALVQALRLDGVVTLVDAVNAQATLDAHVEAVRQAAVADRIVITKSDLAQPGEVAALRGRLRSLNPRAPMLLVSEVADATILECGLYDARTKSADVARWLGEAHQHHDHGAHAHHDHGHGHHDARIVSRTLVHDGPVPFAAIDAFIDLLRTTHGERLLRLKGIVELAEDPSRPLVIHGVRTHIHPPARLRAWPDATRGARIVVIAMDLPDDYLERLFSAVTGQPRVDAPDRDAIERNPLAIAGFRGS
ncbi:MAG: GTP-binding protein [Rhizobiaceae bacterium]